MTKDIKIVDLGRIVEGAAFLGSGGGGSKDAGYQFIEEIKQWNTSVRLISEPFDNMESSDLACIICDIGKISKFDPRQANAIWYAFNELCEYFDSESNIKAVFPIETGPENMLAPFVLAARKNLAVVDGDGAGRAVPTLPLCTFSVAPIKDYGFAAMANGRKDVMLIKSNRGPQFDSLLRKTAGLEQFGDSASLAMWVESIDLLYQNSVSGSVTNALHCGQLIEGLREDDESLVASSLSWVNNLNGFFIDYGIVTKKMDEDKSGFDFCTVEITNFKGSKLTVLSQNESLIVYRDDTYGPLAVAPDSICYLSDDFNSLTNVEIQEGNKVFVVGVIAHEKLKLPRVLKGFEEIIRGLGYAGKLDLSNRQIEPLGDLLVRLKSES